MNKTALTAGCLLLIGCAGVIYWQQQTIAKLRVEVVSLEEQANQLRLIRDEHQRLLTSQPDPDELQRLRSEHSELLKLRGEFTRLKRELRTLQTAQAEKPESRQKSGALSTNDIVSVTNVVTAQLRSNETLITGGWEVSPGSKTFAFVTPQFTDAAGNVVEIAAADSQITLRTRIASVSVEQLNGELNERLLSGRSGPSDTKPLFQALEGLGVDLLDLPAVTTANGRQAQVSVVDLRTAVDPRNVNGQLELQTQDVRTGPVFDFIPTLSPDGASVSLFVQGVITAAPGRE